MHSLSNRTLVIVAVLTVPTGSALAADVTKANNTDALTLGSSWVGGTAPGAGDTIVWDSTVAGANTVLQGGDLAVAGIRIENPGGGVRIDGDAAQTLTVAAGGIDLTNATQNLNLAQTSLLAVRLAMGANQAWDVPGGRTITSGNINTLGVVVTNNGGHALTIDGGGTVYLGGYQGSGSLAVQGGSTLQIRDVALYDYAGGLSVTGGTVGIRGVFNQSGEKPLGSGSLTVHDATLNLIVGNSAFTHGNNVAMSGSLSILNSSISVGNPARDQTFGTLAISGDGTLAVTATGTNDASIIFGATTLSGSPTFDVGSRAGNGLQLGAIGESGGGRSITKTGIGTLRITGASSYTGATTISDGILALASGGSLAGSSGITIAAGAVLDASAATAGLAVAANQSLGGAGSILGSVSFGSDSKLAFTSSLTIDSGTVAFNGFGVDDIVGLDGTVVSAGTYSLLGGTATFDLSAALNVGLANAADIGGGQTAYFDGAGLQVIVVPEPALLPLLIAAAASGLIVRSRLPSAPAP